MSAAELTMLTGWKNRLLTVVLACALGLAAAFVFAKLAGLMWPCGGEKLSCSMTEIFAVIYVPVVSGIALLTFAIAALWRGDAVALTIAALLPLVPLLLFAAAMKYFEISNRDFGEIRHRDVQELLQIVVPMVLTIVIPWIVLWRVARQTQTEKKAHG